MSGSRVGNVGQLVKFLEQFGGCLRLEKKEGEQKDMWKWCVTGKACEKVLIFVLPVIRMKKLQAEAALLMASTIAEYRGSRRKLTTRDKLIRWRMHELLHQLNRRGKPAKEEVDEVVQELEE